MAQLDRQMAAPRFRGVRPMGRFDGPLPADRGPPRAGRSADLVFELMAHPDQLVEAARGLAGLDDLVVVVEHAGWPRSDRPRSGTSWAEGIAALAALGDHVVCKLSGLAMPLGSMRRRRASGPWVEHCHRGLRGRAVHVRQQLPGRRPARHASTSSYSCYADITAGLDDRSPVTCLFAATAERVYRC